MASSMMMHEQLTINDEFPIIARYYDYERFMYPWHFHDEFEIIFVKEGRGERFVADSMELFYPGDVILLGHNIPHYMKSAEEYYEGNPERRVKGVVIQFASSYMLHAINHYADLSPVKSLLEKSARGIHFPYPACADIVKRIEMLPQYEGVERIANLLFLLDKMAKSKSKRLLGSPNFNETLSQSTDNRLEKVLSYITYHYTEKLNLSAIASIVSMNASAFSRYFREKAGKTFIEYILDMRVGYACKLLIGSSLDVSQISIECGFNTLCHFNRIFKAKTGFTPTEYRKQFLK